MLHTEIYSEALRVNIKHHGAELCSVINGTGTEFMWQANPDIWPRHAPVLFPIVGKLSNSRYRHNQNIYELPQHGFARDQPFNLLEKTNNSCLFELRANDQTRVNYPFDFALQIAYQLNNNELRVSYRVNNLSSLPMLFSVGAHPGFRCPLTTHETFEDYYLEFEKNEFILSTLENGLRTGSTKPLRLMEQKLFLTQTLFANDALVFENNQINRVSLCSAASAHKITLTCTNWPFFGIWAKKDCNQFVCLEPWYGVADSVATSGEFIQKQGILELAAQKEFNCFYTICFT